MKSFKVEGLKELDAALGELSKSAGKGVLRRAGRTALQPFDRAWREKAPEAEGTLKASGGVGSNLSKRQRRLHRRESEVEVFAGPGPLSEAVQQEFGNSRHGPQAYVRPAWDETRHQALDIVITEIGAEIDKTAARAARKAARLAAKAGG